MLKTFELFQFVYLNEKCSLCNNHKISRVPNAEHMKTIAFAPQRTKKTTKHRMISIIYGYCIDEYTFFLWVMRAADSIYWYWYLFVICFDSIVSKQFSVFHSFYRGMLHWFFFFLDFINGFLSRSKLLYFEMPVFFIESMLANERNKWSWYWVSLCCVNGKTLIRASCLILERVQSEIRE